MSFQQLPQNPYQYLSKAQRTEYTRVIWETTPKLRFSTFTDFDKRKVFDSTSGLIFELSLLLHCNCSSFRPRLENLKNFHKLMGITVSPHMLLFYIVQVGMMWDFITIAYTLLAKTSWRGMVLSLPVSTPCLCVHRK